MVTKQEMLKKLQETEFPKNTGRQNILKKNQEFSRSMALGKMKVLFKKNRKSATALTRAQNRALDIYAARVHNKNVPLVAVVSAAGGGGAAIAGGRRQRRRNAQARQRYCTTVLPYY
eukprot:COSAG05_NODE_462_length_9561_cov_5.923378_9_plen_117_part_00